MANCIFRKQWIRRKYTPFTGAPLKEIPKVPEKGEKAQWTTCFATEHWAALVDDDDWGLGVIHPGVVRFVGGFYGKPNTGGPNDDSNGYVAAVRQEILDHNIVYEYRYTLVLDTLAQIRKEAYKQRPKSTLPCPSGKHAISENSSRAMGAELRGPVRRQFD